MFDAAPTGKKLNLAPTEPLAKLREAGSKRAHEFSSFAAMIREFHQEIQYRNRAEREEIVESARRMANVRSGKLVLKRDPIHGALALIRPLPTRPRDDRHVYPLAQTNSSQLTSVWALSHPRIVPRSFGNTNKAQIQHALIEQLIAQYDAENFNEHFNQAESLSMMDYGTTLIRVFYDQRLNTLVQTIPILEDVSKTIFEGYQYCQDCSQEGVPGDFDHPDEVMPRCPECGSYGVSQPLDPVSVEAAQVVGQQETYQGDIAIEMLDVAASNWDMRKLAHDSNFFNFRSEVPVRMIKAMLGVDVPESGPEDDYGLSVINALGTRGGSVEGYGRENIWGNADMNLKTAIMDEDYFDPSWYSGCTLTKAEATLGGEEIPAGVPLEQIFTKGINAIGFDDMNILVGAFNEKKRVIGSVYHIQSHSGVGKGTTDSVEIYEQLNSAHSANLAVIKRYGAGGGYGFDKDAMSRKEAKELLKPGGLVGLNMRNTRYNSVENAFAQLKHGELSNANMTMVAQLANLMNIAFQTTEFTSGLINDNIDINTARGQEMLAAQNQQRSAAPLRMKGFSRAKVFEELLELFRECQHIPRYISSNDKFGLAKGRYISGKELPEKIRCDFVPDSESPLNRYTKTLNAQNMLEKSQFFGVPFLQLVQMSPRIASWWAEQYQADIPTLNQQEVLIVCHERVEEMKMIAQQADQMMAQAQTQVDPAQVGELMVNQLTREVFVDEGNHVIKAEVIGEYLDDDEVMQWSPSMKAGIQALIRRHRTYDQEAQQFTARIMAKNQGELQMLAQAPMMQAQAEAQAAAGQAQTQGAALERSADLVAGEEEHARDQEAADLDFARQQKAEDLKFQRDRMAAADDHKKNLEIKKYDRGTAIATKPKPSGSSKR